MVPVSVFSVSAEPYSGTWGSLSWSLDTDGKLTISGTGAMSVFKESSTNAWRAYKTSIKTVEIAHGVTSIANFAFYECTSLTDITIPNTVTSIGRYAFYFCELLSSITMPDNLKSIGDNAFSHCISLVGTIDFPNNVSVIPDFAFFGCQSLTGITLSENTTTIGIGAFFNCESFTSVTIPDQVTTIGGQAFSNCFSLTSVTFGENSKLMRIDYETFSECFSLKNIKIPDGVTSIGNAAFYRCRSLTNVTIPDQVTTIGGLAFADCFSLTSITIKGDVKDIGEHAFYNCYKLVEIYALSSKMSLTKGSTENGYIGYYALDIYTSTDSVSKLRTDTNDYVFYEDGDTCYLMGTTEKDATLNLPIKFNEKDYAIYQYAFYNSDSLTNIIIPNSITSIGLVAFGGCSSLEAVYYAGSETDWRGIISTTGLNDPKIYYNFKFGDLNSDGEISLADLTVLSRHLAEWEDYLTINTAAADVNCDGLVNLADVTILSRYLAGWEGVTLG